MRGARFRHLKRDERGISAVVAAIAIVGLFGALVFSLDAGNLWASKRSMVTATDAGALIGATTAKNNAITTIGPCPQVVLNAVTTQLTANQPTAYQNALNNYNALPTTDPTNHPTYAGAGVVHRIFFNKANARGCGADAAAGNWGMIDFENGANGACLNNDMQYGYFGNLPTCNVGPGEVGIYGPDPVPTP